MREWSRHREILTKAVLVPCQVTAPAVSDTTLAATSQNSRDFASESSASWPPENGPGTNEIIHLLHVSSWLVQIPANVGMHCILSLVRNPARQCDRVAQSPSGLKARTLNASTASSGKAASGRLETFGEECRWSKPQNLFGL
jgi:hypothetical protein